MTKTIKEKIQERAQKQGLISDYSFALIAAFGYRLAIEALRENHTETFGTHAISTTQWLADWLEQKLVETK